MGTYTDFSIAGYPLISSKSAVVSEAMTVFRESDKKVFTRKLGDRNPLVWGDVFADEADEIETATIYACGTDEIIDRLEVMGFTINRVRCDFESGRESAFTMYQEWSEGEGAKESEDNPLSVKEQNGKSELQVTDASLLTLSFSQYYRQYLLSLI
ncbi:HEPN/Toprim-associated domain-containing protein [Vreelandella profundi]|uniref:HEPN/Toprim-associated domain-containing protein n=1 Tax=Vreelandella profundi TaxID=2852117 RepID=UPI001F36030F|nr:HEPN/Toprim-associated domain-containing protein [Halomonas profundi]